LRAHQKELAAIGETLLCRVEQRLAVPQGARVKSALTERIMNPRSQAHKVKLTQDRKRQH
jgi:hypothetical protein